MIKLYEFCYSFALLQQNLGSLLVDYGIPRLFLCRGSSVSFYIDSEIAVRSF